jgi:hypothetical protein
MRAPLVLCIALVAALAHPATATATEPPCDFPACMTSIAGVGTHKRVLVSSDKQVVVRLVEADTGAVLVEIVRAGSAETILATLTRRSAPEELVPHAPTVKVLVTLATSPWNTAVAATLSDGTALAYDAKATRKLDRRALFKRYERHEQHVYALQAQRSTEETMAKEMAALNQACGTQITHRLDFSRLPDATLAQGSSSIEHRCQISFVQYVEQHCQAPGGKVAIATKIKTIVCQYRPRGTKGPTLAKDGTLTLPAPVEINSNYRQGDRTMAFLEALFGTDYFAH